jgi:hypothetical protein
MSRCGICILVQPWSSIQSQRLFIGYPSATRRLPVLAQRSEIYVPAAMPVGLYSWPEDPEETLLPATVQLYSYYAFPDRCSRRSTVA